METLSSFPHFHELPAELRAYIWEYAFHNEYENCEKDRIIELHTYRPCIPNISATVSRRYPTLFYINREARSESAKLDGGEWIQIWVPVCEDEVLYYREEFEVYINFSRDTVFLSHRYMDMDQDQLWNNLRITPEEGRLQALSDNVHLQDLKKIQNLMLSVTYPPDTRRLEFKAYWQGEGLDPSTFDSLKLVTLVAAINRDLTAWTKNAVNDTMQELWKDHNKNVIPKARAYTIPGFRGPKCLFDRRKPSNGFWPIVFMHDLGFDGMGIRNVPADHLRNDDKLNIVGDPYEEE